MGSAADCVAPGVTAPGVLRDGFGFVVLCLEDAVAEARVTVARLAALFGDCPARLAVAHQVLAASPEYGKLGLPVTDAGATVTDAIARGVAASAADWNFVVVAGAAPTRHLAKKYLYFCRDGRDVLFPVVARRWLFHEASINGLFYDRRAVPPPPAGGSDLAAAKVEWASDILDAGGRLKGIVGGVW